MPLDLKEREYLLYRVVRDLFGTALSTTEGDAFAADKSPDALKKLAALLTKHPYGARSEGLITAGATSDEPKQEYEHPLNPSIRVSCSPPLGALNP